jgi:hypothetical protein
MEQLFRRKSKGEKRMDKRKRALAALALAVCFMALCPAPALAQEGTAATAYVRGYASQETGYSFGLSTAYLYKWDGRAYQPYGDCETGSSGQWGFWGLSEGEYRISCAVEQAEYCDTYVKVEKSGSRLKVWEGGQKGSYGRECTGEAIYCAASQSVSRRAQITLYDYKDVLGDGAKNGEDAAFGGLSYTLAKASAPSRALQTAVSGKDGKIAFANVAAGSYVVAVLSVPQGYTQTSGKGGIEVEVFSGRPASSKTGFGYQPAKPKAKASFGVFADMNADGKRAGGDEALSGVEYTLYRMEGKRAVQTAASESGSGGIVSFSGLKDGSYLAKQEKLAGFYLSSYKEGVSFTVKNGKTAYDGQEGGQGSRKAPVWVGNAPYAKLTVYSYIDKNGNRRYDKSKDALKGGFRYTLYKVEGKSLKEVATATSSSDKGAASFKQVTPGIYKIVQSKAKGYAQATFVKGVYARVAFEGGEVAVTYGESLSLQDKASAYVGNKAQGSSSAKGGSYVKTGSASK